MARGGTIIDAKYVGAAACKSCHEAAYEAWKGSDHALAMQHANAETVLGNFSNANFSYAGINSIFFKREGKFFVNTDGPDGKLADYEIKYTFGVAPLQQYLIEFPDGRLQALSIAWDARPKKEGGQRWFHLYPNERITHYGRASLDPASAKLELHVRRLPLNRRAQELRSRHR